MPAYELSLLFRNLPKQDLAAALKRVGTLLLDHGVVLHNLQNLGTKDLPYRIRKEETYYHKGSYFTYKFTGSPTIFAEIKEVCNRDTDILKHGFVDVYKEDPKNCTLEEELLPPALRPSVKKLLEQSKKHKGVSKPIYKHLKTWNYFDIYM
ncbi:unnamed protein product [Larinioides sclopetarius]|uniref:Small ribosomal subunit protein bS6m n=1 Tax=Larinioides sclopetarius TaxID=280406 RepID=A0AAV1ZX61_9ARAC